MFLLLKVILSLIQAINIYYRNRLNIYRRTKYGLSKHVHSKQVTTFLSTVVSNYETVLFSYSSVIKRSAMLRRYLQLA